MRDKIGPGQGKYSPQGYEDSKQHQPEIASLLHLSREDVSRLFARLRSEGAVDFNRGFPVIDRAWLDREAGDPDLAASVQYRDARIDL